MDPISIPARTSYYSQEGSPNSLSWHLSHSRSFYLYPAELSSGLVKRTWEPDLSMWFPGIWKVKSEFAYAVCTPNAWDCVSSIRLFSKRTVCCWRSCQCISVVLKVLRVKFTIIPDKLMSFDDVLFSDSRRTLQFVVHRVQSSNITQPGIPAHFEV